MNPVQHTIDLSNAIVCAMQLDDSGMRKELGLGDTAIKRLRRGYKLTVDVIERLAKHMTREAGWDLNPATIHTCNKRAKELQVFVAEQRAGKDLP